MVGRATEDWRAYYRDYYRANSAREIAKVRAYQERNSEKVAAYQSKYRRKRYERRWTDLRALKLLRGCTDCGYEDNSDALEFDHLPGTDKKFGVSECYRVSDASLIAELNKCEVVCSNCHSIRTATRRRMT